MSKLSHKEYFTKCFMKYQTSPTPKYTLDFLLFLPLCLPLGPFIQDLGDARHLTLQSIVARRGHASSGHGGEGGRGVTWAGGPVSPAVGDRQTVSSCGQSVHAGLAQQGQETGPTLLLRSLSNSSNNHRQSFGSVNQTHVQFSSLLWNKCPVVRAATQDEVLADVQHQALVMEDVH